MADTAALFQPIPLGAIASSNRIAMAPLTRGRAGESRIPNDLMVEYYRQRASAGVIIAEATAISEQGYGWDQAPGIYNDEQVAGWKKVTEAVHAAGSKIVLQLWHVGRASHSDFQPHGEMPVSSSAIAINGEVHTPQGKKSYEVPRALELDEIPGIIQQYVDATQRAQAAGFDGVEVHSANGYLLDQFLRDGVNQRTDDYGGSIENRARLMLEVTQAVIGTWSADRIGVRLSPNSTFNDLSDSDTVATFTYVAEQLEPLGLAYLHVIEALPGHFMYTEGERAAPAIRKAFSGPLMLNGGYDAESGAEAIASKAADLISYGIPFIANPDLPERFRLGAELNAPDQATFYTHDAKGYTDYPFVGMVKA